MAGWISRYVGVVRSFVVRVVVGSAAALGVVGSAGCYAPDLEAASFKCGSTAECPADFVCSRGRCITAVTKDCTFLVEGGKGNVYSCRSDFNREQLAISVCTDRLGKGYHLCGTVKGDRDDLLPAAGGLCGALDGFYATGVFISRLQTRAAANATGTCGGNDPAAAPLGLLGCGGDTGIQTLAPACYGLAGVLPCGDQPGAASNPDWSCGANINEISHRNASRGGGLLCCTNFN